MNAKEREKVPLNEATTGVIPLCEGTVHRKKNVAGGVVIHLPGLPKKKSPGVCCAARTSRERGKEDGPGSRNPYYEDLKKQGQLHTASVTVIVTRWCWDWWGFGGQGVKGKTDSVTRGETGEAKRMHLQGEKLKKTWAKAESAD